MKNLFRLFVKDKPPITLWIFVIFISMIIPLFTLATIAVDVSFLINTPTSRIFTFTFCGKIFLKLLIGSYAAITAYFLLKKHNTSIFHSKLLILIIAFTPLIIEIPFFILEYLTESPAFVIKDVKQAIPITALFFAVFFPYFSLSKQIKIQYKKPFLGSDQK